MRTTIKLTAIALLLFTAGTGISEAQYGRMACNRDAGPLNYCANLPDLTGNQTEKLTALGEEHRKEMDEMRKARTEANDVYERNEIAARMILKQNEHLKSIESLLTDSQKAVFMDRINNGRQGFRGQAPGYGRGNGNRPGRNDNSMGFGRGNGRGGFNPGPGCRRF